MATRATPIKPGKTPQVALNLDTLEREDIHEEFAVVIDGKRIVFTDAADIAWDVLETMDSPSEFVDECTSEEDRAHIYAAKLPAWKFKALWEGYQAHFGLSSPGNARA
jgi:hypothetical protein